MQLKNYAEIQRSLGVIEGIALGLTGAAGDALLVEVAEIEKVINKEMFGGENNENKT